MITSNDRFEMVADLFMADTGMLRPGKSQPDAMNGVPSDEERQERFSKWIAEDYGTEMLLDKLIIANRRVEELQSKLEDAEYEIMERNNNANR